MSAPSPRKRARSGYSAKSVGAFKRNGVPDSDPRVAEAIRVRDEDRCRRELKRSALNLRDEQLLSLARLLLTRNEAVAAPAWLPAATEAEVGS
jgi:hypothetical protein